MTRWVWTVGLLVTFSSLAHAQPPRRGNQGFGPRNNAAPSRGAPSRGARPANSIMEALDVNHDQTLSAVEIQNAPAFLLSLDKNQDGALSQSEWGVIPLGASGNSTRVAATLDGANDRTPKISENASDVWQAPAIQWFATLSRGLAEAKRTGKPILFVSGNPSCAGVSGMWCPGKGNIDSTYLHKPEVIEAAQDFVCIRLTAYENESERVFMSKLVKGQVSNTAFAILAPDGTSAVHNGGIGKGPSGLYKDSVEMAKGMKAIAANYSPTETGGLPALPVALNAKVGLVVAAADNQPLVLVLAATPSFQQELETKVAKLAWSKAFSGRFVYATATSMDELPMLQGHSISDGILLIEPDMFGAGGAIVGEVSSDQPDEIIAQTMRKTLKNFVPIEKSRRDLASLGLKAGIFYETGIPVSGKGEANDRERYRQQLQRAKGN